MTETILIGNDTFVPFLTEEEIQARVKAVADELMKEYEGKTPIFLGILNGAFMFMADLLKHYESPCEVDFMRLSSYGDEKISSGKVKMLKDLACDVNGRDLIIVEDIVDSGLSIKFMEQLIEEHHPASMKVVTLLLKPNSLKYNVKIDYIGFEIPSKFVIGYGLDYAQKYRNLRSIYVLKEENQ
ncbi:MAG: hypoxanthine phosphoribosyltransferase [Ignavibacteriaceae bacterium]|jgi:hypoxanthine phosphoribosyltransferase|nr:hypoxanthine phosphoribosyltransferase [Ignavibacteriaceae bacterium]